MKLQSGNEQSHALALQCIFNALLSPFCSSIVINFTIKQILVEHNTFSLDIYKIILNAEVSGTERKSGSYLVQVDYKT